MTERIIAMSLYHGFIVSSFSSAGGRLFFRTLFGLLFPWSRGVYCPYSPTRGERQRQQSVATEAALVQAVLGVFFDSRCFSIGVFSIVKS